LLAHDEHLCVGAGCGAPLAKELCPLLLTLTQTVCISAATLIRMIPAATAAAL